MRTFVAVEISNDQVINMISKFQLEINVNAKPVKPQNLHFTLQFLGEISEEKIKEVIIALKKIEFSRFSIQFIGVGGFPNRKFPRIIWIGTDTNGGNALNNLAKKVEDALSPLDLKKDKPFKPHITIFRIKNKIQNISKELQKFESFEFGNQDIASFKIKQSVLTSNGPIYFDLGEVCSKN